MVDCKPLPAGPHQLHVVFHVSRCSVQGVHRKPFGVRIQDGSLWLIWLSGSKGRMESEGSTAGEIEVWWGRAVDAIGCPMGAVECSGYGEIFCLHCALCKRWMDGPAVNLAFLPFRVGLAGSWTFLFFPPFVLPFPQSLSPPSHIPGLPPAGVQGHHGATAERCSGRRCSPVPQRELRMC